MATIKNFALRGFCLKRTLTETVQRLARWCRRRRLGSTDEPPAIPESLDEPGLPGAAGLARLGPTEASAVGLTPVEPFCLSPEEENRIAEEAAWWVERLTRPHRKLNIRFDAWLRQSPHHMRLFCEMTILDDELRCMGEAGLIGPKQIEELLRAP